MVSFPTAVGMIPSRHFTREDGNLGLVRRSSRRLVLRRLVEFDEGAHGDFRNGDQIWISSRGRDIAGLESKTCGTLLCHRSRRGCGVRTLLCRLIECATRQLKELKEMYASVTHSLLYYL